MALANETRLGPYEVHDLLGAGGMGEVYRARDTRLGREVALKVLSEGVAGQTEWRARFEREARLLASLNHPHIGAIHELLVTDDGMPVLVLELVEGETLATRIARGPLPLREALNLASQIAEALEAAHERGILHRDLKPSNVMLTREGKAKLLDFGLGKASEGVEEAAVSSSIETVRQPADATRAGAVVGTAPYMSPEQARGEKVDKRADVWAFGCVLFEMLAGRRAFSGASRNEAIASVLEREPDWGELPEATPATVRGLVRRCLRKDRGERLHDIADARIELKEALEDLSSGTTSAATHPTATAVAAAGSRHHAWPLWIGGLIVGVALGLGLWLVGYRLSARVPTRLTFSTSGYLLDVRTAYQHLALAPDGRRVAFLAASQGGISAYLSEVGEIEAKEVPGTDGASTTFFSPDGQWVGFASGSRLLKAPVGGGSPEAICDIPGEGGSPGKAEAVRGAAWASDGTIVFSPSTWSGLWRVPAEGGKPRPLTTPDPLKGELNHRWPQVMPGGRSVLFTIVPPSLLERDARIGAASLEDGQYRVVLEGTGFARYISTGHILYTKLGSMLAAPFDVSRLAVTGPPVAVLNNVQSASEGHFYAALDVSPSGALAYIAYTSAGGGVDSLSLFWVDRDGRTEPVTATKRNWWSQPRLSPDGRRLALEIDGDAETSDIWVLDLERDTWDRVTSGGVNGWPVWSPDGGRLAFASGAASGIRIMTVPTNGSQPPQLVAETHANLNLEGWSPDGRLLLFSQSNPGRGFDIGVQPLMAGSAPSYLLASSVDECSAALSPDGRWMAYVSKETGDYEVYAQPFPALGQKYRVSTHNGYQPRWSRDGRELFYRSTGARRKLMAVAVQADARLHLGRPRPLFDDIFTEGVDCWGANYDVAADGRFVFFEDPGEMAGTRQIVLIPDFAGELKQKLRVARR